MTEKHLEIKKTARYYTLGEWSENTEQIFFVIHGYGMNAKDFLVSLEPLANEKNLIIAPEALNRYYLKMAGGVVGATWMTREDRLNEMKDYINYLEDLYLHVVPAHSKAKVTVLGFSQGSSTATRWVNASKQKIDTLIDYAGEVAPELLPLAADSGLRKTKNIFICGNDDEYFTPPLVAEMKVKYQDMNFTEVEFKGKHVIDTEVLAPYFEA